MAIQTEWNADHLVPRVAIVDNSQDVSDGYARGMELTINQDGYVFNNLRVNTHYSLQCRTQAIYFGMISDNDGWPVKLADMDDEAKKVRLEVGSTTNGHYLATGTRIVIRTTPLCRTLIIKAATNGAVVNIAPLGSVIDPPDLGRGAKNPTS